MYRAANRSYEEVNCAIIGALSLSRRGAGVVSRDRGLTRQAEPTLNLFIFIGAIALRRRRTLPNTFGLIKKHLERIDPRRWFRAVVDPRHSTNLFWPFAYLQEVLFGGMLSGARHLRAVETFSEIYGARVPDTTLHDVLVKLDGEPLRAVLVDEVKDALRSHELPKAAFPVRITAIDGKSVSVSEAAMSAWSDALSGGGQGQYRHMALRALHVSNATKLFLGQREIPSKSAETTEFRPFLDQLIADYGKTTLLEVISVDAGMVSQENADYIISKELDYVMALKGPQQTLYAEACEWIASSPKVVKTTTERTSGKQITRQLSRSRCFGRTKWAHLREVWYIKQTTVELKTGETSVEERFFLCSLRPETLGHGQVMQAIRMHWGVENNGFWTLDTVWVEDDAPWAHRALVFVSLLRLLAYNAVSRLLTRRLQQEKVRALRWEDILKSIEHACCQLRYQWLAEGAATPLPTDA
jgi:hypothetical protein